MQVDADKARKWFKRKKRTYADVRYRRRPSIRTFFAHYFQLLTWILGITGLGDTIRNVRVAGVAGAAASGDAVEEGATDRVAVDDGTAGKISVVQTVSLSLFTGFVSALLYGDFTSQSKAVATCLCLLMYGFSERKFSKYELHDIFDHVETKDHVKTKKKRGGTERRRHRERDGEETIEKRLKER